jgi:hypothetical protein
LFLAPIPGTHDEVDRSGDSKSGEFIMPFIRFFLDCLTTHDHALPLARTSSIARFIAMGLSALAVSWLFTHTPIQAQQWVVDDAAVTEHGACQVEAWWGENEQWVLPACTALPRTEIAVGVGRFDRGAGATPHLFGQAKLLGRDVDTLRWGWGAVVGAALSFGSDGDRVGQILAYVPVSLDLETLPLVLHGNAGWALEREIHDDHSHDRRGFLWGLRGDLALGGRLGLLAEVSGFSGDMAQAQAGIRLGVIPDRLALDLSYGLSLDRAQAGLGVQVGIAWTPAPIRPVRP